MAGQPEVGAEAESAWAAIIILSGYYPPESRPDVQLGLLDAMQEEFAAGGIPAPGWMDELRDRASRPRGA